MQSVWTAQNTKRVRGDWVGQFYVMMNLILRLIWSVIVLILYCYSICIVFYCIITGRQMTASVLGS